MEPSPRTTSRATKICGRDASGTRSFSRATTSQQIGVPRQRDLRRDVDGLVGGLGRDHGGPHHVDGRIDPCLGVGPGVIGAHTALPAKREAAREEQRDQKAQRREAGLRSMPWEVLSALRCRSLGARIRPPRSRRPRADLEGPRNPSRKPSKSALSPPLNRCENEVDDVLSPSPGWGETVFAVEADRLVTRVERCVSTGD